MVWFSPSLFSLLCFLPNFCSSPLHSITFFRFPDKLFGVICVEDLHAGRMAHNHRLAKSIYDAAWSEFFSKLSCKAEEAGRCYVAVNPAYTCQDCSRCHHRQAMPLCERIYTCLYRDLAIDRDHNASLNILAVGLHSLGIQPVEAPA